MQIIDLGKIRFEFKGDYASNILYEFNDCVSYQGNVYICVNSLANTGVLPSDTNYWSLMLEGFSFKNIYNNSITYEIGDVVSYDGIIYIATAQNTNILPTDTNYWSVFAASSSSGASLSPIVANIIFN